MTPYFDWLAEKTPTRWWHDSAIPEEIKAALKLGALGVTTNPVLTFKSFQADPEFWRERVAAVSQELAFEDRAEALLKLVATYAADLCRDIYEKSGGSQGMALGQLNPSLAGDAEAMLAQARRYRSWAPNIAIKLPATRAGSGGGRAYGRGADTHLRHHQRIGGPGRGGGRSLRARREKGGSGG